MEKGKIWTKDFVLLLLSNLFVILNFYLLMTSMAVFAIQKFQVNQSHAGLAASIFVIGALFSRLLAGKYIDVIGRKKMLYGGLILFLIASFTYLFVTSMNILLTIRFIHGIAFGVSTTVLTTAATATLSLDKMGEGTGYISLSSAAGTAIGPFLALHLTVNYSYNAIFYFCITSSTIAFVLTTFATIKEMKGNSQLKETIQKKFQFQDFFEKKALPISLLMFLLGIAYSSILSFINSYAIEIDLTKTASFFFVVYAIFLFIGRPVAGKLFDKKGENIVVYPSFIFLIISFLLLAFANSSFILLLAGAILALGYGTLMSSLQAIATVVSPPERLGLAISTFFTCLDGGIGIGAYIIGLIVEQIGFHYTYIVLSIVIFLLIPVYYLVHGKKVRISQVETRKS